MWRSQLRWFILVSLLGCAYTLYEDQIGKFDWRHQYIGCPHEVHFDTWGKGDRLLVSTKEHVFASLSVNTGHIVWRRIQEDAKGLQLPTVADDKAMFTISDSGRVVRAWSKRDGALLWQKPITREDSVKHSLSITVFEQTVVVLSSRKLYAFSKNGESLWTAQISDSSWSGLSVNADYVSHLYISEGILYVKDYSLSSGKASTVRSINTGLASTEDCVILHNLLVCGHENSMSWVDITSPTIQLHKETLGFTVRGLKVLDRDFLLVNGLQSALVFAVTSSSGLNKKVSIEHRVDAAALSSSMLVVISGKEIEVYDMETSKIIFKNVLPFNGVDIAPVKAAYMSSKNALELLVVGADCRMEFFVVDIAKSSVTSEWVREEALARISAVEMIDLPLSELQQMIEDEFEERGSSDITSSLVRRLVSQASQIHKWILDTMNQMFSVLYVITTRTNSFSKLLDHVRSAAKLNNRREKVLERDFFNLQKMIVATSLDGVVFGIDSSDGDILWRLYLDSDFTPLVSLTGKNEVPLFVQRSTTHYQLPGQASVAFKGSNSAGILVFFNPITGKVSQRTQLSFAISRVDVLSFVGQDHIHPLVVIGQDNQISLHPPQPKEILMAAPPVYILLTDSSRISGAMMDFLENKIIKTWEADLHITSTEKIIEIKGKPMHQKVHSQGRVLIDRNVQYKYVNPNLVAIGTLDSVNQYLSIFLVDVVSGQMIHSARLAKVTAPVHIVHCEHWIAYSYWSEKGRRTEIGVIELYEGGERTNKDYFDSLSPLKQPPELVTQSFIYAQGINAMAVSETEQGITTRSLLLALPLGGIHEITRKLLDATRPLEITQEMREEMVIPYIPEIPIATEDMVNYNQTVHAVRGIKTAASGLESTSLMLAYGIDVFFTRLHPSGTFDILKDDFDHVLISVVLFGLIAGSIISKKFARNNSLSAAWS
ncbi:hypothetical protein KIN20_006284 [Parelaphostrongylus tenuis]|uniref:ER membrane protein complex subunit 1 n=1 Tax=Parelaphostrongylus tenuis TaxID=148309 RepID=A0AAD5QKU9_PARTN|nr:hypothetical protein KIN20_006284 [Parelaphostrongylus tenuis]